MSATPFYMPIIHEGLSFCKLFSIFLKIEEVARFSTEEISKVIRTRTRQGTGTDGFVNQKSSIDNWRNINVPSFVR